MQSSDPSGPQTRIQLGRVVQGAEKATQFPSAIEDALERPPLVILARLGGLRKVNPLLERLTRYRDEISRLRRHLEVAKRWTTHKDSLTEDSAKTWLELEEKRTSKLRKLEDEFWELNVPDIEERARLRILEGVVYLNQKEGRESDLTDLLTDDRFQQVNHLGSGLKRPRSESVPSVPKRGPVLARLGDSAPAPIGVLGEDQRSVFKDLTRRIVEGPGDGPKGKESKVSRTQTATRDSKNQPDLSVPEGEQDWRGKPSRPNPQRRQALRAARELDSRAPRGAPQPREGSATLGRGQTKNQERAQGTKSSGPRVTNGPPERAKVTPPTQIDLTDESPGAGAIPPTPTQETGREDPKGPGKGQEVGEQRACDQTNPLKVT